LKLQSKISTHKKEDKIIIKTTKKAENKIRQGFKSTVKTKRIENNI